MVAVRVDVRVGGLCLGLVVGVVSGCGGDGMDTGGGGIPSTGGMSGSAAGSGGTVAGGGEAAGGVAGGGAVDGPATGTATGVAAEFYPYVDGGRWTYVHTDPQQPTWQEEVALDAAQHEGRSVLLLSDSPGPSGSMSRSYLERSGTEVRRIHKEVLGGGSIESVTTYAPGFPRFDEAWATMAPGATDARSYQRDETLADGTQTSMTRVQKYTLEQVGVDVTVPAGSFSGCLVMLRQRQAPGGGPPAAADVREKRYWFCPGVGKVREENLTDGGLEELQSCSVPGGNC